MEFIQGQILLRSKRARVLSHVLIYDTLLRDKIYLLWDLEIDGVQFSDCFQGLALGRGILILLAFCPDLISVHLFGNV